MPTSTFFGSHPRSWQVPPNGRESMTATLQPASRHAYATVWAAEPVPITITSTLEVTVIPPVRLSAQYELGLWYSPPRSCHDTCRDRGSRDRAEDTGDVENRFSYSI